MSEAALSTFTDPHSSCLGAMGSDGLKDGVDQSDAVDNAIEVPVYKMQLRGKASDFFLQTLSGSPERPLVSFTMSHSFERVPTQTVFQKRKMKFHVPLRTEKLSIKTKF